MAFKVKIDFVSDVMCPWCAVGLHSLLQALDQLGGAVDANIHFRPFELAPDMESDGEYIIPHLCAKYGISEAQVKQNQAQIAARGEQLGFRFDFREDSRKWNTFDAHRLLHWAGELGCEQQLALKKGLLEAYFTHNRNPSDPQVLGEVAAEAGLDSAAAQDVLRSGRYADEVRQEESLWQQRGVRSVPTIVFNERYALTGGQPVEAFVEAILELQMKEG
ncbi:DsbA family oxidoreductase [Marinobacterium sediminicola]|uniref:Predicted dithiol-disulfide isomerase, DsbA family n=1 Tax=Marinobacterium sediminicola TaxID=518898 RepID=A0ABY1S0J3_9GAMM|nr:DsbA family oxidoreductase [Marinobacterium sediminicola]ULG70064.1 DsbA family oxidoreductase [Marinobacterium sediminicola]SMR74520.1 Predicted dithiol-disulfide isomerase, DsbA family [Marinobacterium sediminicola]